MKANCELCAGACCESFLFPQPKHIDDAARWLTLHATPTVVFDVKMVEFECRCTKLTPAGRCGIYDLRPGVCKVFEAGGPECRATLARRRTPEQVKEILRCDASE